MLSPWGCANGWSGDLVYVYLPAPCRLINSNTKKWLLRRRSLFSSHSLHGYVPAWGWGNGWSGDLVYPPATLPPWQLFVQSLHQFSGCQTSPTVALWDPNQNYKNMVQFKKMSFHKQLIYKFQVGEHLLSIFCLYFNFSATSPVIFSS